MKVRHGRVTMSDAWFGPLAKRRGHEGTWTQAPWSFGMWRCLDNLINAHRCWLLCACKFVTALHPRYLPRTHACTSMTRAGNWDMSIYVHIFPESAGARVQDIQMYRFPVFPCLESTRICMNLKVCDGEFGRKVSGPVPQRRWEATRVQEGNKKQSCKNNITFVYDDSRWFELDLGAGRIHEEQPQACEEWQFRRSRGHSSWSSSKVAALRQITSITSF